MPNRNSAKSLATFLLSPVDLVTPGADINPISIEGDDDEEDESGLPEKERSGGNGSGNLGQWTTPVYQFFHPLVLKFDEGDKDCPYTWFACNSKHCKASTGANGIRRYMDKSDAIATKNVKRHATKCFCEASVEAAAAGVKATPADTSLHAVWAQQSSSKPSAKRPFTFATFRATLVRWFTESNRPMYAAKYRKFEELIINGRPGIEIHSQTTIARDIKTSFEHGPDHISKLLNDYPGKLSFTTDAWTSPNHRAFVAWTVHLQHKGKPLNFLLDIFEVHRQLDRIHQ
ncbi:hypothetical protein B0H14DRAFT_3439341 [Mycena olivaceomarginata]|nr:hypothetical protein B0H14DRAFT_3439341 [Mycena olivaceomarginata]